MTRSASTRRSSQVREVNMVKVVSEAIGAGDLACFTASPGPLKVHVVWTTNGQRSKVEEPPGPWKPESLVKTMNKAS